MNLREMNKEELLEEFIKASDNYIDFTTRGNIMLLREFPEFKAIKRRIHDAVDEMNRRKKCPACK